MSCRSNGTWRVCFAAVGEWGEKRYVLEKHAICAVADAHLVVGEGEEATAAVLEHVQYFLGV